MLIAQAVLLAAQHPSSITPALLCPHIFDRQLPADLCFNISRLNWSSCLGKEMAVLISGKFLPGGKRDFPIKVVGLEIVAEI